MPKIPFNSQGFKNARQTNLIKRLMFFPWFFWGLNFNLVVRFLWRGHQLSQEKLGPLTMSFALVQLLLRYHRLLKCRRDPSLLPFWPRFILKNPKSWFKIRTKSFGLRFFFWDHSICKYAIHRFLLDRAPWWGGRLKPIWALDFRGKKKNVWQIKKEVSDKSFA